jgi:hypothetical protein
MPLKSERANEGDAEAYPLAGGVDAANGAGEGVAGDVAGDIVGDTCEFEDDSSLSSPSVDWDGREGIKVGGGNNEELAASSEIPASNVFWLIVRTALLTDSF